MKKLTTLFTVVALATTLGLAGCKKDKKNEEAAPAKTEEPAKTEPAKTEPAKTDTPPAGGEPAKTDTPPAGGTAPAAGGGSTGMPECDEYLKAVEKLASCDKYPAATKDQMMKGVEAMKQGWTANMPDDAKKAAADGCKSATDALKQGASALGCSI